MEEAPAERARDARVGRRPGQAQVQRRQPQHGVVRRHRLHENQAGLAVSGAGDGHMVEADSGLGHGPEHHDGACRRGAEDGPGRAKQPERLRASLGPRAQYVSLLLSKTMREHEIRPSMGSISSPWDNTAMESLMGIVKSECVHARVYATSNEAALEIFEYIEVAYNRARIHSALSYMSPAEFEGANWLDDGGHPKAA